MKIHIISNPHPIVLSVTYDDHHPANVYVRYCITKRQYTSHTIGERCPACLEAIDVQNAFVDTDADVPTGT